MPSTGIRMREVAAAALVLAAAACTIEDAGNRRAADSAAAASAPPPGQASAPGAAGTTTAQTPAGSTQTSTGAVVDSTGAPVPTSPGLTPSGAPTTSAGTPASGNLSPDSVDVGRTTRSSLLPLATTRVEVDLTARQLHVYDREKRVGSYRVAVGSKQWPTQAGEWSITQVVFNPEWKPPKDEAWAESKDPKKPGAPDNPLGRAQLVYDPPRTVHGTNEPQSIGKAVSHGSIRLSNADVVKLARQLMEVTGVSKDDAWYRQVQQNRTEKVVVDLPQRVAIRVF
jgi:lipoprotein-anchoring transpeptidase ErfK/SrfK